MSTSKRPSQPAVEACESRLALSGGVPSNLLAVVPGEVQTPHAIANVSFPVTATNLNRRHSIIVGASVRPNDGNALLPSVINARDPSGKPLPLRQGVPSVPGKHNPAHAYIRTGQAGDVTTGVTGRRGTTGGFQLGATLPGDVNGDGQVTLADENVFRDTYRSTFRSPKYLPSADANQNGQIGHGDAKFLLRNLRPLTPKVPLSLFLTLAPEDAAKGPTSQNSGGVTHHKNVTILGHTTPGAFIFADDGLGDYAFKGDMVAADANGNFAFKVSNTDGINSFNFLAIDPYGQQVIRAFPIYWIDFAAPRSKLK